MTFRVIPCDPGRLRRLLDDELPAGEKSELIEHLDACPACQRALEQMAAESRWWGDARLLDGQVPPDVPPTADGAPRGERAGATQGPASVFLDPPEGSESLGRLGPSRDQLRSFVDALLDVAADPLQLRLRNDWPETRALVEGVAQRVGVSDRGRDALGLLEALAWHQHARESAARLP